MAEGSSGIMDKLREWRRGSTDTHQDVVTTHREAGMPLPPQESDSQLPPNKSVQPGDTATELHPGDADAMSDWRAPQQRQSEFAAQATESGVQTTHPAEIKHGPVTTSEDKPQ